MNTPNDISVLKEIRKNLESQNLSVMVGAGFSKNVHSKLFPSWRELLLKMVFEMKGEQFKADFAQTKKPLYLYRKYRLERANEFINEFGPLNVASIYRDFNGFREILEWFIEHNIPYVSTEENIKYLNYFEGDKKKKAVIEGDELALHIALINLPWNNIYTTNYDNLLESCIEENVESRLSKQAKDYRDEIIRKGAENSIAEENRREAEEIYKMKKEEVDDIKYRVTVGEKTEDDLKRCEAAKQEAQMKVWDHERNCNTIQSQLELLDEKLSSTENILRSCLKIVCNSADLAIKKSRNIIKLHGSLRTSPDDRFGFDQDSHLHYIIAKEDYENYPQKHEAFTQLMRISLLQESICLIGFSGVDPNFLAWLGWVRDVVVKGVGNSVGSKIYLIEVSDTVLPQEKDTFYANHSIAYIPIMSETNIEAMESELNYKVSNRNSKREVLSLFFDYISSTSAHIDPRIATELAAKADFESACNELLKYHPRGGEPLENGKLGDILSAIGDLSRLNRIASPSFIYDHARYHFLRYLDGYVQILEGEDKLLHLQGIYCLIKSQYYPHSILFVQVEGAFERILNIAKQHSESIYEKFLLLDFSDAIWTSNKGRIDELSYYFNSRGSIDSLQEYKYLRIMNDAIHFRFDKIREALDNWVPEGHWKFKKATLMCFFDRKLAYQLDSGLPIDMLDSLVIKELIASLKFHEYLPVNRHRNVVRILKGSGLKSPLDYIELLTDEISKEELKLKPYGSTTFSISWGGRTLSNINPTLQSIQVFGILFESGVQCTFSGQVSIKQEHLYNVAFRTMSHFPFVTLYYLMQYISGDVLKRIGQDYVQREDIDEAVKEQIFNLLTIAYLDNQTPHFLKDKILIFLSALVYAVRPNVWEPFLLNFVKQQLELQRVSRHRHFVVGAQFIHSALPFVQCPVIVSNIIVDCLKNIVDTDINSDEVVEFLFCLAQNPNLRIESTLIRDLVGDTLLTFIEQIDSIVDAVFILGNIDVLLNFDDRRAIFYRLKDYDYPVHQAGRSWPILLYFITESVANSQEISPKDRGLALKRFKRALLKNKKLWDVGFTDNGLSSNSDPINLRSLRYVQSNRFGLSWTPSEALRLYKTIQPTLRGIQEFQVVDQEEGVTFSSVLTDMFDFLEFEVSKLMSVPMYPQLLEEVAVELYKSRGFKNLLEGFASSDPTRCLRALGLIYSAIYRGIVSAKDDTWPELFNAILYKLLFQSAPRLDESIYYVSILLFEFKDNGIFLTYKPSLLSILRVYSNQLPKDCGEPYFLEQLVRISFVLKHWGMQDILIDKYCEMLKSSPYNNIRYNLRYHLEAR